MKKILIISSFFVLISCQNRGQDMIASNNTDSVTFQTSKIPTYFSSELIRIYGKWEKEKSFKSGSWDKDVEYYYNQSQLDTLNNTINFIISESNIIVTGKCQSKFNLHKGILSVYNYKDDFQNEDLFLKEFGVNLKDSLLFIEVAECTSPFNKIYIFLGRLIIREYGAYYTSFKKSNTAQSNCINASSEVKFPFTTHELKKYNKQYHTTNCTQGDVDEFLCGEAYLRYIPLIKRDSLDIILVPLDCGDFNLHQLLVLKNNLLISNIQVDGKWYEVDNPDDYKLTQFTLDKDLRLNVTIDEYQNNALSESNKHNYLIDKNGFIVEE